MTRRIVIIGGPRVGKSTLAEKLKAQCGISNVHSSHDLEHLDWSAGSEFASQWFSEDGDWIVEGVQMARALRKWLKANPEKPLDVDILRLNHPFEALLDGQVAMTKGVETVFSGIENELVKRGARIHRLSDPSEALNLFPLGDAKQKPEAMPMALKRKLTKEEFEKLSDAHKELYSDPGNNGNYVLDAEPDEDTAPLKTALEREKETAAAAKKLADELTAKYKDFDPEKYKQLMADAEERARDSKKKSGDWEGWKQTFLDEKTASDKKYEDTIATLNGRINTFLLDNKIAQAALEAGVLKKLVPHVVQNTKQFFRLDQKENIEVLDGNGNPISVSVDNFFKDKYVADFPEYYEGTNTNGGSGASNADNRSQGGARVVSRTDQAALNANIEKIAKGEIVVQA